MKHSKTLILYETPNEKVICIYGSQIFDATQNETQQATIEELKRLGGKRKKRDNIFQYFKLSGDNLQSSKRANSKNRTTSV